MILSNVFLKNVFAGEINQHFQMIHMSTSEDYNPIYLIAAALDPNTVGILSDTELNSAAEWICKMLPCEQCPRNVTSVSAQESSSILDEILFKLTEEQKQNRDNNSLLASRKKPWVLNCLHMTQNISRGIDPIKYWNGYLSTEWHIIATFALDILSISGSGAPIEAVFSQAEIATTSRRNKTGSELLNAQLIIYCNRDILHQIS